MIGIAVWVSPTNTLDTEPNMATWHLNRAFFDGSLHATMRYNSIPRSPYTTSVRSKPDSSLAPIYPLATTSMFEPCGKKGGALVSYRPSLCRCRVYECPRLASNLENRTFGIHGSIGLRAKVDMRMVYHLPRFPTTLPTMTATSRSHPPLFSVSPFGAFPLAAVMVLGG